MSTAPVLDSRDRLREAARTIQRLTDELAQRRAAAREPIAIVGLGLRMPGGAQTPDEFWRLLDAGVDATREFPRERGDAQAMHDPDPDAPGRAYVMRGGFLDRVDGFDAATFGISPREAVGMDPQQRLALELAWEALERAGYAPDSLADSATGVFLGVSTTDYVRMRQERGDPADIDHYQLLGEPSFIAGRISFALGLQGPSAVVDTTCSSSLVAVHQACRALRDRTCDMVLAGGVNLMLSPYGFVLMSKFRALAPDGRCKTFDEAADGYARGEGGAILVLKRLSDALAADDRIEGVVLGSAVNHDGHSSGLTVPNPEAQKQVMRAALADAGLEPAAVGYLEAHGTGTSLGDPIELRAVDAVYGPGRDATAPLLVGSVKTNIGHLEPAAGVAGMLKALLSIQHGNVPPHLNLTRASSQIPWRQLRLAVPTRRRAWPQSDRRTAAVSSFGASGTNAHAILAAAPDRPQRGEPAGRAETLLLSARTPSALRELAERYAARLAGGPAERLEDVAFTTQIGRARLGEGAAVVARSTEEAIQWLRAVAAGKASAGVVRATRTGPRLQRTAWLFGGQGAQHPGMGAGLRSLPAFESAIQVCAEAFDGLTRRPLDEVLSPDIGLAIHDTELTQPALFTLEYALAQTLLALGARRPAALLGHSVGEIVAACVGEALSLPDAARLVAARGRLMSALPAGGAMLALATGEDAARAAVAATGTADTVAVAAVNGSMQTVVSGVQADVERVGVALEADGVRVTPLITSHAFHSPLLDPMLHELRRVCSGIEMQRPSIPIVSNLTGGWWDDATLRPDYWVDHARSTVRFADGLRGLHAEGVRTFVELGPHAVLTPMGRHDVDDDETAWISTLQRGVDDHRALGHALAAIDLRGSRLQWPVLHEGRAPRRVDLPTYPWERERFWFAVDRPASGGGPLVAGLGRRLAAPVPTFEDEAGPPRAGEQLTLLAERSWRAAAAAGAGPLAFGPIDVEPPVGAGAAGPWVTRWTVRAGAADVEVHADGASPEQARSGAPWQRLGTVVLWTDGVAEMRTDGVAEPGDAMPAAARVPRPPHEAPRDRADAWGQLLDDCVAATAAAVDAAGPGFASGIEGGWCDAPEEVEALALHAAAGQGGTCRADLVLLDAGSVVVGRVSGLRWSPTPPPSQTPWYPDADLLLDTTWCELPPASPGTGDDVVVLVGEDGPAPRALLAALGDRGVASELRAAADDEAMHRASLLVLVDAIAFPVAGELRPRALEERVLSLELQAVELVRRIAAGGHRSRLVLVSRGAMATPGQRSHCPGASTLAGLGRVLALEHPEAWGGLIDLDPDGEIGPAAVDALLNLDPEDEQAVRGDRRLASRVVPADAAALPGPPARWSRPGTVLVTGGLGGIGAELTRRLAAMGTERIVLTARTPLPPEAECSSLAADDPRAARVAAVRRARAAGAEVRVLAVDAADGDAMRELVDDLAADPELPLRGVVHAAGVSIPQIVDEVDGDSYAAVWRPKVIGAWALHEATRRLDLDFFVCFSSIAASWGSQHLAAYAASNAFLDGLARARRAEGLPALSVAWGPWDLPSNLFGDDVVAFLESVGLRRLAASQCLTLLGRLVVSGAAEQVVCAADWSAYRPIMEARRRRPRLSEITVATAEASGADEALLARLAEAHDAGDEAARRDVLADWLSRSVADVLRVEPEAVGRETDVFALGLDSLMVMEVVGRVRRDVGVPIEPSALFERDTVVAWAEHVRSLLDDDGDAPAGDAGGAGARTWESADALAAVSVLAPDIVPVTGGPAGSPGTLRRVLLTGATGFVGAYLLDELLRHGAEEVLCLVRCTDPADGLRRIADNAAGLRPLTADAHARIRVVPGDLGAEGLGLSAGDRRAVAAGLDAIFHNGAWVNFAHTFDQLRAANVAGTEELLRLAARSGAPLHHVSTYGIFGLPVDGRDVVREDDDVRTAGRLVTGYVQSKWAAEHLVHQAAQRGMPVAIYRLGRVVGDSRTGLALTRHFTSRVIKGCIQLGAAPDLDIDIEMTPVDYVARAFVHLAAHRPADGSCYHLVNRRHMPFAGLVAHLERRGWPLEVLPAEAWWQRLEHAVDSHPNELHPVMGTVRELIVGGERAIAYDATCVERALDGTGIVCPPLDTGLLDAHLDYFVRSGHLSMGEAAMR